MRPKRPKIVKIGLRKRVYLNGRVARRSDSVKETTVPTALTPHAPSAAAAGPLPAGMVVLARAGRTARVHQWKPGTAKN